MDPAERKNIIRYAARVCLFFLPVVVIFGAFDAIAYMSGELMPIRTIIRKQAEIESSDGESIYGRRVADQELQKYKYLELASRKDAEVIAVGSSRVLQFRKEMFEPHYTFYNAGSIAQSIGDIANLAEIWPEGSKPKVLIIGIDTYWFNDKNSAEYGIDRDLGHREVFFQVGYHAMAVRYLAKKMVTDFPAFVRIAKGVDVFSGVPAFGFQAKGGDGFRSDGSYQYGTFLTLSREGLHVPYRDREKPPIIERVKEGKGVFEAGGSFDPDRLALLESALRTFKSKGIFVAGVMMPYSNEVHSELSSDPRHRTMYEESREHIPAVFEKFGYPALDFSDPARAGLTNDYFFDGLHVTEPGAMRVLALILRAVPGDVLSKKQGIRENFQSAMRSKEASAWEVRW